MDFKNFLIFFVTYGMCYGIAHSSELDSNLQIEYPANKTNSSVATNSTTSSTITSTTQSTSTKVPDSTTSTPQSTSSKVPDSTTSTPQSTSSKVPDSTTSTPQSTSTKVPDVISTMSLPTTTEKGEHGHSTSGNVERHFDGPSFIGGIVSTLGLSAIGFVAYKYFRPGSRGEPYKYL